MNYMGGSLFAVMIINRLGMWEICKRMWPFVLVELVVLFLITYIPEITVFIPKLLCFYS